MFCNIKISIKSDDVCYSDAMLRTRYSCSLSYQHVADLLYKHFIAVVTYVCYTNSHTPVDGEAQNPPEFAANFLDGVKTNESCYSKELE